MLEGERGLACSPGHKGDWFYSGPAADVHMLSRQVYISKLKYGLDPCSCGGALVKHLEQEEKMQRSEVDKHPAESCLSSSWGKKNERLLEVFTHCSGSSC